ncbi:sugar phosphate isomerase/epimerase family protein [Fuchsiella alkaliacetigena]|uniref:sugar phosphate isomerase/epimerase family protein n=1 Tax=Fuchsiella alkaliacetigena TaxID=957042 RepID=UPI00200ACB75|nr:TIM barrel protein [Fuchsiella alkaliacetigena]MCK8823654.1 sugar phosphate isomerase/epimerase [Fuchsiella alkaliacetigena]
MKKLFNFSIYSLEWFDNDWQQVIDFCDEHGFAGVELSASGLKELEDIKELPQELIVGMHLAYYLDWLPLNEGLVSNIELEEVRETYRQQLDLARQLQVDYVVFHASSVTPAEIFTQQFNYNDREVLESVAEVINDIIKDLDLNFKLLFENLWWSGLTFLSQEDTLDFLKQVNYEEVGLLLDTGHLMNTSLRLNNEKQALDYLNSILQSLPKIWDFIYGVHLHKSLSGSYRYQHREKIYQQFKDSDSLAEKEELVREFITKSDQHLPFTEVSPAELLQMLKPEYLIHEFISDQQEEFMEFLQTQDSLVAEGEKV